MNRLAGKFGAAEWGARVTIHGDRYTLRASKHKAWIHMCWAQVDAGG